MTTNNNVRFSAVCLSGTIMLTEKLSFALSSIYLNQCVLSGGPPLGGLIGKSMDLPHLLEDGYD